MSELRNYHLNDAFDQVDVDREAVFKIGFCSAIALLVELEIVLSACDELSGDHRRSLALMWDLYGKLVDFVSDGHGEVSQRIQALEGVFGRLVAMADHD